MKNNRELKPSLGHKYNVSESGNSEQVRQRLSHLYSSIDMQESLDFAYEY
jgi:hypothetical protein